MARKRTFNLTAEDYAERPQLVLPPVTARDLTAVTADPDHPLHIPTWRDLPDDKLAPWVDAVRRFEALGSPARFAAHVTNGAFKRYRHVEHIDRHLYRAAAGDIRKLMVWLPPRHSKSFLTSHYGPAWYLSTFPERRVMLCAYEADFAASWGRKARTVLEDHPELGIEVASDSKAANRWDLAGHAGGMVTAGVGGPITGKGANWLIIDDPVKNAQEAMSETVRQTHWDWYLSTALTRLEPDPVTGAAPSQTIVQTRWHEDDLSGRLLREQGRVEDGGEWTVVCLPALAEADDPLGRDPGEALCPERYDVDDLEAIRDATSAGGATWWSALYQQRPQAAEGGLFKRAGFRHWRPASQGDYYDLDGQLHRVKDCFRFMTVDLAASKRTRADWTVAAVWDVTKTAPANLILVHRARLRLEGPDHLPLIRNMADRYKPTFVGIEKASFGMTLIQEARRRGMKVRELIPDRDKVARALDAATSVEAGQVWFPASAPWLEEWESELLAFPNGTHDDQVDVLAYAALTLDQRTWFRAKRTEAQTVEERIWAKVRGDRKRRGVHPELGRW